MIVDPPTPTSMPESPSPSPSPPPHPPPPPPSSRGVNLKPPIPQGIIVSMPSTSHGNRLSSLEGPGTSSEENLKSLDSLFSLFSERFTEEQISAVYEYSRNKFDNCVECLGNSASLEALVGMVNKAYSDYPVLKVYVDEDDIWADLLSFYKCVKPPTKKRLRIKLSNSPSIDTGGVRRQVYTVVFSNFTMFTFLMVLLTMQDLTTVQNPEVLDSFKHSVQWLGTPFYRTVLVLVFYLHFVIGIRRVERKRPWNILVWTM